MTLEELLAQLASITDEAEFQKAVMDAVQTQQIPVDDLPKITRWTADNRPYMFPWVEQFVTSSVLQAPPAKNAAQLQEEQDAADAQAALEDQVQSVFTDVGSEGGRGVTESESKAAKDQDVELPATPEPRWILDKYNGPLTLEQQNRVVADVGFLYGQHFNNFSELVASGVLNDPTQEIQQIVDGAVFDTPPEQAFQFNLPSGDLFTVKADEWKKYNSKYNLDERQLVSFVKMVDTLGVKNDAGKLDWQPVLALANMTGLLGSINPGTTTRILGGPGSTDMGITPQRRVEVDTANPDAGLFHRPIGNINPNIWRGERLAAPQTNLGLRDLITDYQTGMNKYHDNAMAVIYAYDPSLAGRIAASGGDPGKIRAQDLHMVQSIFSDELGTEWYDSSALSVLSSYLQLADARNQAEAAAKKMRASDGGSGAGKVVRQHPDPATLNESIRALYQQMFLEDPDEATLAKFRAQINAAVDAMQEGDSIDIGARAKEFARKDPRYNQLYGNKPGNVSEEDYQRQFRAGQASMLGAEVGDNAATLSGMRSGKYQTTIGAAAGMAEAWDNSTFLGRLAHAAQIVGENT